MINLDWKLVLALLLSIIFFPWWLNLLCMIVLALLLENKWWLLPFTVLWDMMYEDPNAAWFSRFGLTILTLVIILGVNYIYENVSFPGRNLS